MTQKEALDILKTGRNVFLTGAAGSGKTHTLREYIAYLRGLNTDVAVTASTGIAATHMGGMTIHSWSGLGIKNFLTESDLDDIAERPYLRNRMKNTSVLIIDEISMLHHFRLDLIDAILRRIKGSWEPFGGIQVVLCGDFFQLPPVTRIDEPEARFAYHSPAWQSLGLKICYLTEQHRQNDLEYLGVLNSIRDNEVSESIFETLNTRFITNLGKADTTKLYSHNVNVDSENERELEKLSPKVFEYHMESRGAKKLVENLMKSCLAPETLRLKEGARVMFVKNNFEKGYVNGTTGVVTNLGYDFIRVRTLAGQNIDVEPESWRIEEDGVSRAEISQFPLRLAWAITVHKSQGMSLDAAEIDLSDCFVPGMGYVALSRVRSLSGLYLKGLNQMALQVNEEVLKFDNTLRRESKGNRVKISKLGEEKIFKMQDEFREKVKIPDSAKASSRRGKKVKGESLEETKKLFAGGLNMKEIAQERNLAESTIFSHLEKIKKYDPSFNLYSLRDSMPKSKFQKIYQAFQKIGLNEEGHRPLTPVFESLGGKYSYEDLRLVRLFL